MFSQKVEYALRAVVHLAAESPAPRTVEQIARATKVPQAYLAKVIQELVAKRINDALRRGELVAFQRGGEASTGTQGGRLGREISRGSVSHHA